MAGHKIKATERYIYIYEPENDQSDLEVYMMENAAFHAGKIGTCKDLGNFDKNQIVMARRVGKCISKMAGPYWPYQPAKASTMGIWASELDHRPMELHGMELFSWI